MWDLMGLRESIIQQAPHQWLALWTVDDVFAQSLPETLGDAADNLPFNQARVDDTATVVDSDIAQNTYRPSLSIYLNDYSMRAKGKRSSREGVGATDNQPALSVRRPMCLAGSSGYKLREGQLLFWLVVIEGASVLKTDVIGWTRQELRGEMRQVLTRLLHYGIDGRAAHDEAAASTGAFAQRKEGGVAMAHAHLRGMHA